MELTFQCPGCGAVATVSPVETLNEVQCSSCGRAIEPRAASFDAEGLRACPVCATEELYLRKDFPQGLGLVIVIAGFAASTVFWYFDRPVPALGILLISALADMVLYRLVPDVTICYRCLSQIRGEGSKPEGRFHPFDLAIGERFRQERIRVDQLRGRSAPPDPATPPS